MDGHSERLKRVKALWVALTFGSDADTRIWIDALGAARFATETTSSRENVMSIINITSFFSWIVDRFILIADHYIVERKITLSEGFIFALFVGRSIWASFFGAPKVADMTVWAPIFWVIPVVHAVSLSFKNLIPRALVMALYGVAWGFIGILWLMIEPTSLAVPSFFVCSALGVFISVRLFTEQRQMRQGKAV